MIQITPPHDMVSYYVNKWRELDQMSKGAQLENLSLKEVQSGLYQQLGYVDSFLNYMPTFIGRALSSDYGSLEEYNQITKQLTLSISKVNALENEKAAVIRQVFSSVIGSSNDDIKIKFLQKQVDQLVMLEQKANLVLSVLSRAENSEWWDGHTSDHVFVGAMNDFESRKDNFLAGQMLGELNQQIRLYNQQLSFSEPASTNLAFEARPLQELYGVGENIINSELNEGNPLYKLGGGLGDWWSSGKTLRAIRSAQGSVIALGSEIHFQRTQLQQSLNHYVMTKLMREHPGFVEEANLVSAHSLAPNIPQHLSY